ncbi:MAG: hypothetical protein P1Q69_19965 [Candidatus Thorarchaeota archaeon]|nr:hypothetical protein [Candidatus Thorarchaeota archaeon]
MRSMPPWTGPGNEFAQFFNIGSLVVFGFSVVIIFLSRRSIKNERSKLAIKLVQFEYSETSIHRINRLVLLLGGDKVCLLIGGMMILMGVFPISTAFIPLVNIDVVLPILPLAVTSLISGIVIFTLPSIHYKMNWKRLGVLISRTDVVEEVHQEYEHQWRVGNSC